MFSLPTFQRSLWNEWSLQQDQHKAASGEEPVAQRKMNPGPQHNSDAKRKMDHDTQGTPDAKRPRLEYKDAATVIAGGYLTEQFIVHTEIATAHSDFFRKACLGGFKEAKDATVSLPEIKANTFRSYVHWLYTGDVIVSNAVVNGEQYIDSDMDRVHLLTELYIAADMLMDLPLRNATIDALIQCLPEGGWMYGHTIVQAYENTPERSTIRRLFVDNCQTLGTHAYLGCTGASLPHEFLFDLVKGRIGIDIPPFPKPTYEDRCKYHEHNEQVPKCGSITTADGDIKTEPGKETAERSKDHELTEPPSIGV